MGSGIRAMTGHNPGCRAMDWEKQKKLPLTDGAPVEGGGGEKVQSDP